MSRFVVLVVVMTVAGSARAQPAPLVMPELVARSRLDLATSLPAGLTVAGLAPTVRASHAVHGVEVFGALPLAMFVGLCFEGCRAGDPERAVGNLSVGARAPVTYGALTIAPALRVWLPTSSASVVWWLRARQILTSATDTRAFADEGALGATLAIAWRGPRALRAGRGRRRDRRGPRARARQPPRLARRRRARDAADLVARRVPHRCLPAGAAAARGRGIGFAEGRPRSYRVRAHVMTDAVALGFDLVQQL